MKKFTLLLSISIVFILFIKDSLPQTYIPLKDGNVRRFGIGVNLKQATSDKVMILNIVKNSSAESSGLKPGDIIHSVEGLSVKKRIDLIEACRGKRHKDIIEIQYQRDSAAKTAKVQLTYVIDNPSYIDGILLLLYEDRTVNLAIVPTVKNLLLKGADLRKWSSSAKESLLADCEKKILNKFKYERKFSLIDRSRVNEIIEEISMSQAGLTSHSASMKFGNMLGATHILFLDLTRYHPNPDGIMEDQTSRRLIEIESGKVISSDVVKDEMKVK